MRVFNWRPCLDDICNTVANGTVNQLEWLVSKYDCLELCRTTLFSYFGVKLRTCVVLLLSLVTYLYWNG